MTQRPEAVEEREELLRVVLAAAQEMQQTGPGGISAWLTPKNAGISLSGSAHVCSWESALCQTITTETKLDAVTHLTMLLF